MPDPKPNNPPRTIFRFRYSIKANEYVVRPSVIRDTEKGVVAHDLGALVMDEGTFTEFRSAVSGNPLQFEFFES